MKLRYVFSIAIAVCLGVLGMLPLESFREEGANAPVSIGEFIYTVPLNKEVDPKQAGTEWYYQFLEPTVNDSLFTPLLEKVRNKTLRVYSPEYPFTKIMDPDSAILRIDVPHYFEGPGENGWEDPQIYVYWEKKHAEDVIGITFHEEWFYDAASLSITKKVLGIIPIVRYERDYNLFYKNEFPAFYIPFTEGEVKGNSIEVNGLMFDFQDSVYLNNSAWYCPLQNNQSKLNVQAQNRLKLVTSLKDRVKQKNTDVYSPEFPFTRQLSKQERADVISHLDSDSVLLFREDWRIDLTSMHFVKIVSGFSLGREQGVDNRMRDGDSLFSQIIPPDAPVMLAYFPMNNSQKVSWSDQKSVSIPTISYLVKYQTLEEGEYKFIPSPDSLRLAALGKDIHDKAKVGSMKIFGRKDNYFSYDPWLRNESPLQEQEVFDRFNDRFLVLVEDGDGNYYEKEIVQERPSEEDSGFRFYEKWKFDVSALTFSKDIVAIGLTRFHVSSNGEVKEFNSTFFIYHNPLGRRDSILQPKYLVVRNFVSPVLLNRNEEYTNEDDNGRPIYDYIIEREENIEASLRYQFVQQVIDGILEGTINAYDPVNPQRKFSAREFRAMIDSTAKRNSVVNLPGREFYIFNELQFTEDWYYNPSTCEIAKQVNAITFSHRTGRQWWLPEPATVPASQEGFVIRLNSAKIR